MTIRPEEGAPPTAMGPYSVPEAVGRRALHMRGRSVSLEHIDAARTALVVVDMQNHFVAAGFPMEVPAARAIVPTVNRIARALRAAGGTVVWIQTTAAGALQSWRNHPRHILAPERARQRLASLDESATGYALFAAIEAMPGHMYAKKTKYSAFIAGSSTLDQELRAKGIDTLLICGTATNVCCESTARDATMLDYRVAMLSDATATWTDEEHRAALTSFVLFFGDVLTTEEALTRLVS